MKGATQWQHDISPLTKDGNKISIFNNGHPRTNLESDYFENSLKVISNLPINQVNNNPSYFLGGDFKAFGLGYKEYNFDFLPEEDRPKTFSQGRGKLSNNGKYLFVESTDEGRLLEVDLKEKKIIWSFINRAYKEERGYMMNWSRKINKLPFDLKTINFKECNVNKT